MTTNDAVRPAEPLIYGLRKRGELAILGLIPVNLHAPETCTGWYEDYEEIPLHSAESIAHLQARVEALIAESAMYKDMCEIASVAFDNLNTQFEAMTGEVDDLREEVERLQYDYALLANESIYDGNSIGWIASKAKNCGRAILDAWGAVKEVGGKCDGNTPLHQAIREQLTARTNLTQPEADHG